MSNIINQPTPGKYRLIERETIKHPLGTIGVPKSLEGGGTGLGDSSGAQLYGHLQPIIENIRNRKMCTMLVMPNIEHAKFVLDGPQTQQNLNLSFADKIDPFGFGPNPAINGSFDTTLAQPSQTQTHMIVCAIGWHLRPEPLCFTASGMSSVLPASAVSKPFSPDIWTTQDTTYTPSGASAPLVATTAVPANLEWGWWTNYAAWLMVAGYNLRWQIGQNLNIIFDELRNTAYMPNNAQDGSASSSQVDDAYFTYLLNQYYQSVAPGSNTFLKTDTVRLGSINASSTNYSVFTPTRDLERVEATFGGIGLRELLKGNSEFRPLTTPYILGAGIPIGLFAEQSNNDLAGAMRAWMSISNGTLGTPPTFNDYPVSYTSGATTSFGERTLDGNNVLQTIPSQRATFKGGRLIVEVKIKGFEISEDLHTLMKINSRARDMICSECQIAWAPRSNS